MHLGNLRTALVSWLAAHHRGGQWLVRMEDLDRVTSSAAHERRQLADLAALGMVSDVAVVRQSERFARYDVALESLRERGLTYECFCTRREIAEAAQAPHGRVAAYPGTCRELGAAERSARRAEGRPAAIRLRAERTPITVEDRCARPWAGVPDDIVLRRNDGVPAYHLAVVVDDAAQNVTEVVRGDDLLSATPSQMHLQRLLGLQTPAYAHIPLVLGPSGQRLAKRDGAVTMTSLVDQGWTTPRVLSELAASLGLCEPGEPVTPAGLAARFSWERMPRRPWVPAFLGSGSAAPS